MKKSRIKILSALIAAATLFTGCNAATTTKATKEGQTTVSQAQSSDNKTTAAATETTKSDFNKGVIAEKTLKTIEDSGKTPKYIFLFVGDGMSAVQVNAAQVYNGDNKSGEVKPKYLSFSQFPVMGLQSTYDSTSFAPDSASTATALSCGIKTHSGVIGLGVDKKSKPENITEKLKKVGYKTGIVSTVTLNHATPAAFYAHNVSRNNYYEIALEMAKSGVDYFGGGELSKPTGDKKDQKDAYDILRENGYKLVKTKEEINALNKDTGKVYAMTSKAQDSGSMNYLLDKPENDLQLSDYVRKGIDVLDNEKGFFMMVESGKVDWACHANDALAAIQDVIQLESAVNEAIKFAEKHPEETLIIVTGDHETGGMTIGQATTGYDTAFNLLSSQKKSYVAFDEIIKKKLEEKPDTTFEEIMPLITENFGLKPSADGKPDPKKNPLELNEYDMNRLKKAFAETLIPEKERQKSTENTILYGGYNPLSVTITHILNNKAGIGWTSYSHTGVPVPVFSMGAGANKFAGSYDNTDIFNKLVEVTGVK